MDSAKFQEAQQAYDSGDFRNAAKSFLASAGKGTVGNGAAYHMAGNALMRLRRHSDAVTVYGHALRDETYDRRGAVQVNLASAFVALGELSEAIAAYEAALEEPGYATPYKAWQGIGSVHLERSHPEDAAVAYRKAALDESNPNPGKALVNLGLSFMAMRRPADAVDAYKAALGFDSFTGRGKALANLGQAYAAMGDHSQAVSAFEKAVQLHAHKLSAGAQKAYDDSLAAMTPPRETVEGWDTGEMASPAPDVEPKGWGTGELSGLGGMTASQPPSPVGTPGPRTYVAGDGETHDDAASKAAAALGFGDDAAVKDFFSLTEDEMRQRDREARRNGSRRGGLLKSFVTTVVILGVIVALLSVGYYFGLGWPDQATTVNGLFSAYAGGQPVEKYWVAVPKTDVKREMAKVPPVERFRIDGIQRAREVSRVRVTVTPEKGAPMQYLVILGREGVGWRVTGVDYNWRSTGS
jgi:Tfp pilus assembly protein PilF